MSLVATLICNPANPALDSTIVDGALAVLPSPGTAQWLFEEVAVDIPFESGDDVKAREAGCEAVQRRPICIDSVLGRREVEDRLRVAPRRGSRKGH